MSEIIVDPAGHLVVSGRPDGRDLEVDGMLRRTAGKSVHYSGEVVVLSLLMQFGDICHHRIASGNSKRQIL